MEDETRIEEREDGPLLVRNLKSMTLADGSPGELKPVRALCRCGGSRNKPFCDGSHKENGFKSRGGTPAGKDRLLAYEGAELTVSFNPLVCSHATECNRLAPHIFDATKRPWISPDAGTRHEIEAAVRACPSGALSIATPSGPGHLVADRAQIEVQKDGPYWVTGISPPAGAAGEAAASGKYVLCRCGLSGNKPYCDGSHRDAGWSDED